MNKSLLILITVIFSNSIFSQKKLSFELSYPLPVSNTFVDETGIVGVGLKYAIKQNQDFTYGLAYNLDVVNGKIVFNGTELDRSQIYNHLDAYGQFGLSSLEELNFLVSVGYSLALGKNEFIVADINGETVESDNKNSSGFNFGIGSTYDVSDSIFLLLNYRYINTFVKSDIDGKKNSSTNSLINIGAGIRF